MAAKGLFQIAEFKFSVTDMAVQGIVAIITLTSGFWQSVPIAFLIPALLVAAAATTWLLKSYNVGTVRDSAGNQPLPPDATLPRATPEELSQRTISNRAFFIYDVPRDGVFWMQIRGKAFKDCQVFGPAVVELGSMCIFNNVGFGLQDGIPVDRMLFTHPDDSTFWGVTQLEACTFDDCRLVGIAVAGSAADIARIRRSIEMQTTERQLQRKFSPATQ